MKIFLDTSSLFKLYHREVDTELLEQLFSTQKITDVFLSEISKIEFTSTVWKKVRMKEITEAQARNPPSAAGPTIELPSRRPSASAHPVGMVDSDFDVFHPFRGN